MATWPRAAVAHIARDGWLGRADRAAMRATDVALDWRLAGSGCLMWSGGLEVNGRDVTLAKHDGASGALSLAVGQAGVDANETKKNLISTPP